MDFGEPQPPIDPAGLYKALGQLPATISRTMPIRKFFSLYSAVVCWAVGVGAIPAPTSTVTIYEALPLAIATANSTPLVGGTFEVDVSVVGVSTGSAGTETTYSIGEYVSFPASTSVVVTLTSGETSTVSVQPSIVYTENFTLIESAGGFWASQAITTGSGPSAEDGTYLSCAFDANGGPNASCLLLEYFPSTTFTQTFAASKDPLAIVSTATIPTTSSNAAIARYGGSYGWKSSLYTLFLCVSVLILAI